MTLRKTSISLGSAVAVVRCGITRRHRVGPRFRGGGKYFGCIDGFGSVNRAPQPNLRLPGAASRPSNRDLRTRPNIVGRALGDETQDPDGGGLGLDWQDD